MIHPSFKKAAACAAFVFFVGGAASAAPTVILDPNTTGSFGTQSTGVAPGYVNGGTDGSGFFYSANNAGHANGSGGFGYIDGPQPGQFGIIQSTGAITTPQFVLGGPSDLELSFVEAGRAFTNGDNFVNIFLNNLGDSSQTLIGSFTSVSASEFAPIAFSDFGVAAGTYSITFAGAATTDETAFIDSISLQADAVVPEIDGSAAAIPVAFSLFALGLLSSRKKTLVA